MRTSVRKVGVSLTGALSILITLVCFGSQGAEVIFTKSLSTNLTLELLLEKLPPRDISERVISGKEVELYRELERKDKRIRPLSFNRYRLFVSDASNERREEVWSKSLDIYDHGPHFPAPVAFLDALLVHSNLFVCYKTYGKLLVEQWKLSPQSTILLGDSSTPTTMFEDTLDGWVANSARFLLANDSALTLEVRFPYDRRGRWAWLAQGIWEEQPIETEVKPGVIVSRTAGIDVSIIEARRQTNASASAVVRCSVYPATCRVTANGVSPSVSNGHYRVFTCPLRSENDSLIRIQARLKASE